MTQGKLDKLTPAEWVALERVKREARNAPILAAAKAELERQLNAGLITTRGGRKTRSAHLTHLAVEAADQ